MGEAIISANIIFLNQQYVPIWWLYLKINKFNRKYIKPIIKNKISITRNYLTENNIYLHNGQQQFSFFRCHINIYKEKCSSIYKYKF